jgi:hypothetical protein
VKEFVAGRELWSPVWLAYLAITQQSLSKLSSNSEKRLSYILLGLIRGCLSWIPSPLPPYLFALPLALTAFGLHLTRQILYPFPFQTRSAPPGSPVSVPSPRNSDKRLRTRHGFFECRPSPAYRTGNGEALESRANSCIHDIRIPLERCRIHGLLVTNLNRRRCVQVSPVWLYPEASHRSSCP